MSKVIISYYYSHYYLFIYLLIYSFIHYLFIYLFIYLFMYFFISLFLYLFSAPNQNVSHDILNLKCTTLVVLAHIRFFLKSLLQLQSLHVVYLNFTVCIFNRIR